MSSAILLHQLQLLDQNRKSSSSGKNLTTSGKRKRNEEPDLTVAAPLMPLGLIVTTTNNNNHGIDGANKNKKNKKNKKQDTTEDGNGQEQARAKRFAAALEQLAAQDGKLTQGRSRQKRRKDGQPARAPARADALLAAARRANARQQADRTRANLQQLKQTDRATEKARPHVRSVISLSGRDNKKRKERKWHIVKDDLPREVPDL